MDVWRRGASIRDYGNGKEISGTFVNLREFTAKTFCFTYGLRNFQKSPVSFRKISYSVQIFCLKPHSLQKFCLTLRIETPGRCPGADPSRSSRASRNKAILVMSRARQNPGLPRM